ncbi:hypothetical protein TMEC54S_00433 [Thauera mechernichensis]
MKIVKLDQRSQEWHDWRAGKDIDGPRITASNIAVIAGISPFKSRYQLWEEMTGRREPDKMNPAMAHGVETEDEALAAWIQDHGDYAQPCCIEHDGIPWVAASLDGLTLTGTKAVEIKCPYSRYGDAPKLWVSAQAGEIPAYYLAQMQWQMFASNGEILSMDFWVYWAGKGIKIPVQSDPLEQQRLYAEAKIFREAVINDDIPATDAWIDAASAWRQAKLEYDMAKETLDARAKDIENLLAANGESSYEGCGIVATKYSSKGAVDYGALFESVKEHHGIDLVMLAEQFRKDDSERFKITFQKKAPAAKASTKRTTEAETEIADAMLQSAAEEAWF